MLGAKAFERDSSIGRIASVHVSSENSIDQALFRCRHAWSYCRGQAPITSRSSSVVPLTERALRLLSSCHMAPDSESSPQSAATLSDFAQADDLFKIKCKVRSSMSQNSTPLVISGKRNCEASLLHVASITSRAESASINGTIGGSLSNCASIITQSSVKPSPHLGARRSPFKTLKKSNTKKPNEKRDPDRVEVLRRNLDFAHQKGQLTDVSCALLHELVLRWHNNPNNLSLLKDWRHWFLATSRKIAASDCSTFNGIPFSLPFFNDALKGSLLLDDVAVDLDEASDMSESEYFTADRPSQELRPCHPWYPTRTVMDRTTNYDSDVLWRKEAELRDQKYRKVQLKGCLRTYRQSPFDAVQTAEAFRFAYERRELKPLKIAKEYLDPKSGEVSANVVRDLNMPGIVEHFLKQLTLNGHSSRSVRNQAMLLQLYTQFVSEKWLNSTCTRRSATKQWSADATQHESLWWDHDDWAVQQRRLSNLVYGDTTILPEAVPGVTPARRKEARELYRRLVRALDQRAPPQERLLGWNGRSRQPRSQNHTKTVKTKSTRSTDDFKPIWIRALRSKQLFGKGSDLFPKARYRTRLADFDPDTRPS